MNTIVASSHTLPGCDCRSNERTLVLLVRNIEDSYPELVDFGSARNWNYYPALGAIQINVGDGKPWNGITDVINFLRGVIDQPRLEAIRAVWVERQKPLEEQLFQLIHAEPLMDLAPRDSSQLLQLLKERRIETWYQPIVEARTEKLWGHECLMRGRLEDGQIIGALQIIQWAQQEHLTFMLDRICRETHLENAGRSGAPAGTYFTINFLPTAIYQPEFCLKTSVAAATRSGLRPEQIIFEVVETEKIVDRAHLMKILDYYRRAGFKVALDDVGSGYAGLAMMADLKPDLIKIDRELVVKAVDSEFHKGICASLINLAHQNGQKILAEGVETPEEIKNMTDLGVDLLQGYYYGKPQPQLQPRFSLEMETV